MTPTLAGGFLTTAPQGKSQNNYLNGDTMRTANHPLYPLNLEGRHSSLQSPRNASLFGSTILARALQCQGYLLGFLSYDSSIHAKEPKLGFFQLPALHLQLYIWGNDYWLRPDDPLA